MRSARLALGHTNRAAHTRVGVIGLSGHFKVVKRFRLLGVIGRLMLADTTSLTGATASVEAVEVERDLPLASVAERDDAGASTEAVPRRLRAGEVEPDKIGTVAACLADDPAARRAASTA
jgi:hypothetical protein